METITENTYAEQKFASCLVKLLIFLLIGGLLVIFGLGLLAGVLLSVGV